MGRRTWIWIVAAVAVIAVLAWAWIDGGKQPKRWIEEPVELPEGVA